MRYLKEWTIGISMLAPMGCAAQEKAALVKAMPEVAETTSVEVAPTL